MVHLLAKCIPVTADMRFYCSKTRSNHTESAGLGERERERERLFAAWEISHKKTSDFSSDFSP